MKTSTFNRFRRIIIEESGISLGPTKEALVAARISKRMRTLCIDDPRAYLRYIAEDESGDEMLNLLDAISTNVTHFFRDPDHFVFIRDVVSQWMRNGQRRFRFWSSACSSGEEPYSLAMSLRDIGMDNLTVDTKILATDISRRMLRRCGEAVYSETKMKGVERIRRTKYFEARRSPGGTEYAVLAPLREMIRFRRLNLADTPFPMNGPLDVILCRNVMIYFNNELRSQLLEEMYRLLKPGGYLFVGHAESLTGILSKFKSVRPSIYVKSFTPAAAGGHI